jgi:hypothetical protein
MNATATKPTVKETAQATLDKLGLSIRAEFVPFRHSRNAKNKQKSLNWFITVMLGGRAILRTDYSAGVAHCPAYGAKGLGMRDCIMRTNAINEECEHGITHGLRGRKIEPDALDVFYSLVMDSSVFDCGTFEDWADNFGYEHNSRSAEATYRACLDAALKLRAALGESGLTALREAFQNY